MKIGILGAGKIAAAMAQTLAGLKEAECYAVAARELDRAKAFAEQYGFEKAFGSYEEMVSDPQVELVYVATPHSHHAEHVKLCLLHGKHVLCEKAFTANAAQAEEILAMAEERKLLLTEAIWTRYMPSRRMMEEILNSQIIGTPYMLTANLGYVISDKPRLVDPALAGGALLDVGIYPITFARMVFGTNIREIRSAAILTDRGVDAQNSITFLYEDGRMAVLNSSMMARTDRMGIISGDKGYMVVDNINNPQCIRVCDTKDQELARYTVPRQITGYEYEVLSAIRAVQEGRIECEEIPHEETLEVMRLMDALRAEWGVWYPFEV
ncbi:MAG: Gfo/Idh/MocA family oxidoreductase [Lachnospiraceae bacterium]|nr:Gfo/Idh/MocA family oxidoreductase [Lachnospiraceae bacterium]